MVLLLPLCYRRCAILPIPSAYNRTIPGKHTCRLSADRRPAIYGEGAQVVQVRATVI